MFYVYMYVCYITPHMGNHSPVRLSLFFYMLCLSSAKLNLPRYRPSKWPCLTPNRGQRSPNRPLSTHCKSYIFGKLRANEKIMNRRLGVCDELLTFQCRSKGHRLNFHGNFYYGKILVTLLFMQICISTKLEH